MRTLVYFKQINFGKKMDSGKPLPTHEDSETELIQNISSYHRYSQKRDDES